METASRSCDAKQRYPGHRGHTGPAVLGPPLDLYPRLRARSRWGGQRSQLALTVAVDPDRCLRPVRVPGVGTRTGSYRQSTANPASSAAGASTRTTSTATSKVCEPPPPSTVPRSGETSK